MQIGILRTADSRYGGSRYESMVMKALASEHSVTLHDARPWMLVGRGDRLQSFLRTVSVERKANVDIWIRNEMSLTCMTTCRSRSTLGIIHHLDDALRPLAIWNRCLNRRLLANARRCDRIVAVSKYWQTRLSELNVQRTALIYNAFDVRRFEVKDDDVRTFKEKHGLAGKPVVYIGNCQKHKGAPAVWRTLRDQDYHLVTSGLSDSDLPIRKFALPYDQYILLLAASDVAVTMSEFAEGWNRTAHEALLCKTPVIGSGLGGMGELLKEGRQVVCHQLAKLPEMVRHVVAYRRELGIQGHAFASGFTVERFNQQWLRLVAAL